MDPAVETLPPSELVKAIEAIWRIRPPRPSSLFSVPQFVHLRETCLQLYPEIRSKDGLNFALSHALHALGMPRSLSAANSHLALSAPLAAARLDRAFKRKRALRAHLCPLDMACKIQIQRFGQNIIGTFTADELNELVDTHRLQRTNYNWQFDATRFSEFTWLVVRETYLLETEVGKRAIPLLFQTFPGDLGRIEPHLQEFPTSVEAALFAILLAPWEDWAGIRDIEWRGFRVPWVYRVDEDIFVRPAPPPSPDTLSWEPDVLSDAEGEIVYEGERPTRWGIESAVTQLPEYLNDEVWRRIANAHQSPLLSETPVAHFFVRAFMANGIDEFLAHITTIEAALGVQSDYRRKPRLKPIQRRLSATERMAARVSAFLGTKEDGDNYIRVYNLRSDYLHGRKMNAISGNDRVLARQLARKIVGTIVDRGATFSGSCSRDGYLESLA